MTENPYTTPQAELDEPPPVRGEFHYRSLAILCTWVSTLLGAGIVISLVAIVSSLLQVNLLQEIVAGAAVPDAKLEANDLRQGAIGTVEVVLYLVTAVLFLRFLYLSNKNLRALGAETIQTTPGWLVGYFFIPFINLYRPYIAVRELWFASEPNPHKTSFEAPGLLKLWWGLWLLSNLTGQIGFRLETDTAAQLISASYVDIGIEVVGIVLTLAALWLIRSLAARQAECAQQSQAA